MLPILFMLPAFASFVLGVVFVVLGDAHPRTKLIVAAAFAAAVYLQFFSRFALVGLLFQVSLALGLLLWRRLDSGR